MRSANPDYPEADSLSAVLASLRGDRPGTRRASIASSRRPTTSATSTTRSTTRRAPSAGLGELTRQRRGSGRRPGNGYPCSTFFAADPLLDPLRARDDFQRLMTELERDRDRYRQVCT